MKIKLGKHRINFSGTVVDSGVSLSNGNKYAEIENTINYNTSTSINKSPLGKYV